MLEAYRIGVVVSLTNRVSGALGLIARDFMRAESSAAALKSQLKSIALLGATGGVMAGLGYAGVRAMGAIIKPATEYAHQLNILNMAGLSHVEVAQAVGAAWKNTSTVITTTATDNLRTILDLRNVLTEEGFRKGDPITLQTAVQQLPIVSRIQAVLASSSEAGVRKAASDNFAFSMAKALDIVGAARTPEDFERQATAMAKVITAFQGRVTPQMFQSVFAYARQAKFGLSDEFKYQILPTLMLEYSQGAHSQGGGSRGVGPGLGAFSRLVLQGYINKKAMPELERLGLIRPGASLRTTTSGTTTGPMVGAELARENPYQWVQQVLMPAITRRLGPNASQDRIIAEIQAVTRGNQHASQMILEFALKQQNFLRDQAIIQGAMAPDRAYIEALQNDPRFAYRALAAQWDVLKTAFGKSVIPILIPAMMKLTYALNLLANWARENPDLITTLVSGFMMLSGALAFGGVVILLTAAFKGLQAAITLGGLVPWALRATGVLGTAGLAGAATTLTGATTGATAALGAGGLVSALILLGKTAGVVGTAYVLIDQLAQTIRENAQKFPTLNKFLAQGDQDKKFLEEQRMGIGEYLRRQGVEMRLRQGGMSAGEAHEKAFAGWLGNSLHEPGHDWTMDSWRRTMARPLAIPPSITDATRGPTWASKAWDVGKGPLFGTELPGARYGMMLSPLALGGPRDRHDLDASVVHLGGPRDRHDHDETSPFSTGFMRGIAEGWRAAAQGSNSSDWAALKAAIEQLFKHADAPKPIHIETQVVLDGNVLARSVEDILADGARRPFTGPSSPDFTRTYPSPAAPGAN